MKTATPLGMLHRENIDINDREYIPVPEKWDYNPATQISSLITMGGSSEPTTMSMVGGTTGVFGGDDDQSNDDKGSD
jgi:hypothetical protein